MRKAAAKAERDPGCRIFQKKFEARIPYGSIDLHSIEHVFFANFDRLNCWTAPGPKIHAPEQCFGRKAAARADFWTQAGRQN